MNITAQQIADILEGDIVGDASVSVNKLAKIEEGETGAITFLSNPKYNNYIYATKASIVIVNRSFEPLHSVDATMIRVDDSYNAFTKLLEYYNHIKLMKSGIEQPSVISEGVVYGEGLYLGSFSYIGKNTKIGNNVKIYPNSFVGDNVEIGDNTVLFAGSRIYSESIIGKNCVIHSGTIIGSDGFGFAPNKDETYSKIPQIGNVIIEDDVEIGACTTVDRATLGSTIIRKGVKLDNQIQIAHNVEVGENTVIASQTGIAGSAKIGKHCVIGGQVGIVGHIIIGDNVRIQAQTGVGRSIKSGEMVQGSPAMPYNDFSKSYVYFKKLPIIVKELDDLKKRIDENI
ncbi:MAG TPA: UDP-3-O-(3-hydroxymyristoyl)glucosamine N-acyltransferase [Flavobacterium sp.]|nr:UDP-3-O-(3-hydroxymyristoyl)glucosamine N-acyltransferase [Flavobacterium sp.]